MHSLRTRTLWAVIASSLALAAPARAAQPAGLVPSLSSVPADVAFYSTSLRLGEQMDKFVASKAFAKLRDLPAVQAALKHVHEESEKPGNPLGHVLKALHEPANRDLMQMLHDAFRQEIFFYGGANWGPFFKLLMEINAANRFGPAMAALRGEDPQRAQVRTIIAVLTKSGDKLQIPETVFGFRLSKAEPAAAQIDRLEKFLVQATEKTPLKGRVRREQIAGSSALTISFDASILPWDEWNKVDDELKELFVVLKKITAKICLLVKGDYLILSVGPNSAVVDAFGRGPALESRPEMAPLAKHGDKPLIAVSYISEALIASMSTTADDFKGLAEMAKEGLDNSPLSKERREAILKDVQRLTQELSAALPKPAAMFSCSFLTPRGQESFSYQFGAEPALPPRALSLAEHVGGSPLVAIVSVAADSSPPYQWIVNWLKVFFGHADAAIKEVAGDDAHKQFQAAMDTARPLLEQFNSIVGTQMLPALGDGEVAFVVDGKWTSKKWFPEGDQNGESLPMIELGAVHTVKDSAALLKSLTGLREWVNEVIAKVRETGVPLPEFSVPAAENKKIGPGTAYFWPLPPAGQDEQIVPNLALSPKVVVKSLSLKHSERLMTPTPLSVEGVRASSRPLQMMAVIDIRGLIGVARPWVEKLAMPRALADMPKDAPPGLKASEIPAQVKTVFDVMQCLRSVKVISYRDGATNVTHSELVIEDLK